MTTLQEKRAALDAEWAAATAALRPLREALAAAEKELLETFGKREAELAKEEFVAALPAYLASWIKRAKKQFYGDDDVPPALMESLLANIREKPTFTMTEEEGKSYDPDWTVFRVSYNWAGETITQEKMTNYNYDDAEYTLKPYLKSGIYSRQCHCDGWAQVMKLPEKYRWMAILTADDAHMEALCSGAADDEVEDEKEDESEEVDEEEEAEDDEEEEADECETEEEFVAALPAYLSPWIDRAKEQFSDKDVPPALMESLLANIREKPSFSVTKEEGNTDDPVWTHYRVSYKWAGETVMQDKMIKPGHDPVYLVTPYQKGLHDCYCESWEEVMDLPEKYRWMAILTADYDHLETVMPGAAAVEEETEEAAEDDCQRNTNAHILLMGHVEPEDTYW